MQNNLIASKQKPQEGAKGQPPLIGSTLEAQSLYKSSYYSPSYYFPWNPDSLVPGNSYKIYDEMRDDDQVKVAVAFKKDMVINSGWKVTCEDTAVKEYVETSLKELQDSSDLDSSFEDALRDVLSSYEFGFSLTEPVYKLVDGLYTYESLKTRPPHGFKFELDDYGNITRIVQSTTRGEKPLDAKLFLHHVYQPDFGNPYGKSDLRAVHIAWKAKKFVNKFLAIYLERFAGPTVVGRYPDSWDGGKITAFHNTLKTIQNASSLAIPDGALLDFVQANKDSSDAYLKALQYYNMIIARGILVPDLMGISGEKTGGGSYSLGKEQFKLFSATIKRDRDSLARKINLRLIRPLVQANFGDVPCTFEFLPLSLDDELEFAKLWVTAVSGRVFKPNEDEINHLRAQLNFPEGPVEVPETPNPLDLLKAKAGLDAGKADAKAEEKELTELGRVRIYRDLSSFERKVDFKFVARALDTAEEDIARKLAAAAKKIYSAYIQDLRSSNLVGNFRPERLNTIEPKHLRDMNTVLRGWMRDFFLESYDRARLEIFPHGTKKFRNDQDELLPEDMLAVLNAESFGLVGDYKTLLTKRTRATMIELLKEGAGPGRIFEILKAELPEATERWVQTFVRTKTTDIFNRGRKSYWDNDELAKQVIEAYQFSAIMDERTSDVCRELDGQIFEGGEFANQIVPPLHFNCRSVLVPVTKFEDYKSSDSYVKPGKEPSLEDLQELGGNLIKASQKAILKTGGEQ